MHDNSIIIKTNRLNLRKIIPGDADDLLQLFTDPVAMQYFPTTKNREETMAWIDEMLDRYQTDGFGFFACVLKATGAFIGYCGPLMQRDIDGEDEIEIGYGLIRKYWHNGYASEAAKACMDYAFKYLNAKRIISLIRPENTPSIQVALRNDLVMQKIVFRFGYNHQVFMAKAPMNLL